MSSWFPELEGRCCDSIIAVQRLSQLPVWDETTLSFKAKAGEWALTDHRSLRLRSRRLRGLLPPLKPPRPASLPTGSADQPSAGASSEPTARCHFGLLSRRRPPGGPAVTGSRRPAHTALKPDSAFLSLAAVTLPRPDTWRPFGALSLKGQPGRKASLRHLTVTGQN